MILHVIFDLDGVIYRGETLMPYASQALAALRQRGGRIAFFTNNATGHRRSVVQRLTGLGIAAELDEVRTAASAAAEYIAKNFPGRPTFAVGEQGMVAELTEAGVPIAGDGERAGVVVVGLDRYATWNKLRQAHRAVMNGAVFVASNADPSYPDTPTTTAPAAGSLVAALRTSTGIDPIVIGKPEPAAFQQIAAEWGVEPDHIAAVGDRIDTDVEAARRFGCMAILVLTGIATREDLARLSGAANRAPLVIDDLSQLAGALEAMG